MVRPLRTEYDGAVSRFVKRGNRNICYFKTLPYMTIRDYPETVRNYEKAVSLQPAYAEAHLKLGNAYRYHEDRELAIRSYNNTLRLRPGWALPLKELKQIQEEQ
jgi:Tfp pilus assembly protein PilF